MKKKVLAVIKKMNDELIAKEITNSNGFLRVGDISSLPLSTADIAARLSCPLEAIFNPLDELLYSGEIHDTSRSNMSWGRSRGADGRVTIAVGEYVKLNALHKNVRIANVQAINTYFS